jgi:hypothetical protein
VQSTHVVGIDPGIVHTGVVSIEFHKREIEVEHHVLFGPDAHQAGVLCRSFGQPPAIFIEGYRSRSNLEHDKEMLNAVADFRKETGGTVLDNTGVKKIVKPAVLKVLGAWDFSTPTHHQDLRSAARIAVLGMLKDPDMNRVLADCIRDHIDGHPWRVTT